MTYNIIINYYPIPNLNATKTLNLNSEQLFGIIMMSHLVLDRINISLQNGDIVDLTKIPTLPYFGYHDTIYRAKLGSMDVSFNDLNFISGAITLCLLFGFDPDSIITNVSQNNQPIKLDLGRYFGIVEIPNSTNYPNGIVIPINSLNLPSSLSLSLSRSLNECFSVVESGITVPSTLYMITSDRERSNVLASCLVTLDFPESIKKYKVDTSCYISNVCSNNNVRGQGLSKSIMICMLNDCISKHINIFMLEVLPSNTVAYNLYISLGFKKIASTFDNNISYDLLKLL